MTSKEALKLLETRCRYFSQDNMELEETYEAKETINKDLERLEKLEKVIEILKGRMCVHNGYVCYDAYADIKLKDEEIDLLYEVLSYEEI